MNLNAVVASVVGAVNPRLPFLVQVSVGASVPSAANAFAPGPVYATPGAITASIAGDVLTVTGQTAGVLQLGQLLAGTVETLLPGTIIVDQLTGSPPGGIGTYTINRPQSVSSEAMTTSLLLMGQIQPLQWRDLQQLDGLNLNGVRKKIYLDGNVGAIVRAKNRGGDRIVDPHSNVWLVVQTLEGFDPTAGWTCVAVVLQDGA